MIKTKKITKLLNDISSYENEEMCMIILSQKENKALLKYIVDLEKLDKRIDKAIEYIDTTEFSGNNVLYDGNIIYYNQDVLKCLLNILKGSEE